MWRRVPRLQDLPARRVDPHSEERTRADLIQGRQDTQPLQWGKAAGTQILAAYLGWRSGRPVHDRHVETLACEERGRGTTGRARAHDDHIPGTHFPHASPRGPPGCGRGEVRGGFLGHWARLAVTSKLTTIRSSTVKKRNLGMRMR